MRCSVEDFNTLQLKLKTVFAIVITWADCLNKSNKKRITSNSVAHSQLCVYDIQSYLSNTICVDCVYISVFFSRAENWTKRQTQPHTATHFGSIIAFLTIISKNKIAFCLRCKKLASFIL